jgi:tetratricopeptide (TPR) repeat protein
MSRIKLPGKEKSKKIILMVLVIVAIGILSYEAWINITSKNVKNKNKSQKEIVKPMNAEESYINNTTDADVKEAVDDDSKTNNNDEKIKISEKEKNSSARQNELYNDAYRLFFEHKYVNAISKADMLISEFPVNAMGYNIRGIAKAYNGDYDGGMKDIDTSLSIDKNYGYARFNKALTYELYENMDEALEWYNKALEVEDYVWSYYGVASIYGRRGDVANTMTYLNKAIQIDSGVKEVAKKEHDFDPVNNSKEFQKAVYN